MLKYHFKIEIFAAKWKQQKLKDNPIINLLYKANRVDNKVNWFDFSHLSNIRE